MPVVNRFLYKFYLAVLSGNYVTTVRLGCMAYFMLDFPYNLLLGVAFELSREIMHAIAQYIFNGCHKTSAIYYCFVCSLMCLHRHSCVTSSTCSKIMLLYIPIFSIALVRTFTSN